MITVTITGRDDNDKPTFKASIKQTPGQYAVFTVATPEALTKERWEALADIYGSLLKMAKSVEPSNTVRIADLSPDHIGQWVEYHASGGDKIERGRIKSWNDTGVFVVYNEPAKLPNWLDYTAAHTRPEDLIFVDEATDKD
jgi:hypothetical protein